MMEWLFYILLAISSGMTILSRIINSLGVTTLETSFLSSLLISIFFSVNVSNLLTCFRGFLSYLQLCSTSAKGIKSADWDMILTRPSLSDGKVIYIEVVNIGSSYTRDTCANRDTSTRKAFSVRDACVKDIFVTSICAESTSARSANALKHSEVHLQSFWISELKLFGIRLETKIGAGWWSLHLLQILY